MSESPETYEVYVTQNWTAILMFPFNAEIKLI